MTLQPHTADRDLTIYQGDALKVLRQLPDGCVDCCVTSPPYWGLRDYGTGAWEGGAADCDHIAGRGGHLSESVASTRGGANKVAEAQTVPFRDVCGKCGARRVDRQLGLEATPDEYVAAMVAVFREVRRVLADHGTCWINLGDSYAANRSYQVSDSKHLAHDFADSNAMRVPDGLKPKDLCGVPWRVAFALQADGWYLRSDIIWAKPNPMPESVTDRPTKAHEYVFLLSKRPRYFFDAEAVREPHSPDGRTVTTRTVANGSHANYQEFGHDEGRERWPNPTGRNVRSVWTIATQPYPEAHFATFPEELARRCILAGCPEWVCRVCGRPRERVVEKATTPTQRVHNGTYDASSGFGKSGWLPGVQDVQTLGWSDCGHNDYRPGTVLDPFGGSGTTALVARNHGRRSVLIELNEGYARMAARRLSQLSLLAEVPE